MAKKDVQEKMTAISEPKVEKPTAHNLLLDFLIKNSIELEIKPLNENIKVVSDGSIIIDKPIVTAKYINGR